MRNDFPDHPAGPLKSPPNISEVLEIRESQVDKYLMALLFIVPGLILGLVMLFGREEFQLMGGVVTLFSIGCLYFVFASSADGVPVLRIRPDGIEFPRDETPPLHWHDIASIDLGVMNVIGGGGAHDYLGITLQPGLKYPSRGGVSGSVTKALGQWDFDICYGMNDLNRAVVHIIMEMRARAEAAYDAPPVAPPGLEIIVPGAIANYSLPVSEPESIVENVFSWIGYIFGWFMGIAGLIGGGDAAIKLSSGMSHVLRADGTQGDAYSWMVLKGLVMFSIGAFLVLKSRSRE